VLNRSPKRERSGDYRSAHGHPSAEDLMAGARATWDRIEEAELKIDGVGPGTGFGRSVGLTINRKIYAIQNGHELILKLPRNLVEQMIESGTGNPWGPSKGRIMREWIELPEACSSQWAALTEAARAFVGSR
jgi:hypothetical protein